MNKQLSEIIDIAKQSFHDHDEKDMKINYILSRKGGENSPSYLCLASSRSDPDEIRCITIDNDNQINYQNIPDWDFNIDDYLLSDLEDGYQIEYMTLEDHYNIWCAIEEWKDDIQHQDGLYSYLDHCKKSGITPEAISLLGLENVDIMNLYQEKNENYKIIGETKVGEQSIVIAHNPKSPSPFVTWKTTPTRTRGFDIGHYYSRFKDAYEDYKNRCNEMMEDHLNIQYRKIKPKNKEHVR